MSERENPQRVISEPGPGDQGVRAPCDPATRRSVELPPLLEGREAARVGARRTAAGMGWPENAPQERLPPDAVGLALSGGGIRSATFCLGVLQALAHKGLLGRVDLLSTVSGGGYIGSFLGRLFTRLPAGPSAGSQLAEVQQTLRDSHSEPMRWLRDNGRYLSPNGAGDTWLAGAVLLRNLVALHVVVSTFILGAFLAAQLIRAAIPSAWGIESLFAPGLCGLLWWSPWLLLPAVSFLLLMVPLAWSYWLDQVDTQGHVAALPPLAALATAVVAIWFGRVAVSIPGWARVVLLAVGVLGLLSLLCWLIAWAVSAMKRAGDPPKPLEAVSRRRFRANLVSRWLASATMLTLGLLGFALLDSLGQTLYAVAAHEGLKELLLRPMALPPVAALVGLLALVRQLAPVLERLAGGSRWKLRWDLVVSALAACVVVTLLTLTAAAGHAVAWGFGIPSGDPGARLTASRASSPAVTVTVQGTVRDGSEGPDPGPTAPVPGGQRLITAEARAQAATDADPCAGPGPGAGVPASAMSLPWCWGGFLVCLVLSLAFGRAIYFLNLSSHLTLYAARIARAYLGASNPERWKPAGMHLSEADDADGISWDDYRPEQRGGPLHLVNLTLNETVSGTSRIEHRDRKGLALAVGPCGLSVGSRFHGLWGDADSPQVTNSELLNPIPSKPGKFHALAGKEGGPHRVQRRTLEQWIAASGAAFTTGLGWRTSLGASLLLGLGNVRLGHWWDSHISPRERAGTPPATFASAMGQLFSWAFPVQSYLLDELLARFHGPGRRYWYLSDGGHFENTGCYELIRRRVPFVICCDCGEDSSYQFEDLANLARRVRTDFGAELEMVEGTPEGWGQWPVAWDEVGNVRAIRGGSSPAVAAGPSPRGDRSLHAAVARIRYVEGDHPPSVILFLKPSLTGDEPLDVLNYAATHPAFPQEPTTDQFFDEAQWESYRKLGEHIGNRILKGDSALDTVASP